MSPSTVACFLLSWGFQLGKGRWRYEKILLSIVVEGMDWYIVAREIVTVSRRLPELSNNKARPRRMGWH